MREPAGRSKVGSEVGDTGGGSGGGGPGACSEETGGSLVGVSSPGCSSWESLVLQEANETEGMREEGSGGVAPGIWGIWSNPTH